MIAKADKGEVHRVPHPRPSQSFLTSLGKEAELGVMARWVGGLPSDLCIKECHGDLEPNE